MKRNRQGQIDALLADLRRAAKANAAESDVAIGGDRAQSLADELARLLQSSAFLRRQNAKLRRRIERIKAGLPDRAEDGPDDALEDGAEDAADESAAASGERAD